MKLPYRATPGAGFVLVLLVCGATVAFFAWGMLTPPLETVWRLQIELMVGHREALRGDELRLLRRMLHRHEGIAASMLREDNVGLVSKNDDGRVDVGYAYVIRRNKETPARIVVTPAGSAIDKSVAVRVGTEREHYEGIATRTTPFLLKVPDERMPQLVEVIVSNPVVVTIEARR